MRDVVFTSRFKKDFKREKSGTHKLFLASSEFMEILTSLRTDTPLQVLSTLQEMFTE